MKYPLFFSVASGGYLPRRESLATSTSVNSSYMITCHVIIRRAVHVLGTNLLIANA